MNIEKAILNLKEQIDFEPKVLNSENINKSSRFIFIGMGGSAIPTDLLKVLRPDLDIIIHRDYGLPKLSDEVLRSSLIILVSYSGQTAETIDAFKIAMNKGLNMCTITTGGQLLDLAVKNNIGHVQIPDMQIQPRTAFILILKSILKIISEDQTLSELSQLNTETEDLKKLGEEIADQIKGKIPIIYSSRANGPIAYYWKININETAKSPAFSNVIPEMNHNELAGFSHSDKNLVCLIFIKDSDDDERNKNRISLSADLLKKAGFSVLDLEMTGDSKLEKVFRSVVLAEWAGFYLAKDLNINPEDLTVIEDFKRQLK